jgi:hypothetical protein
MVRWMRLNMNYMTVTERVGVSEPPSRVKSAGISAESTSKVPPVLRDSMHVHAVSLFAQELQVAEEATMQKRQRMSVRDMHSYVETCENIQM